MVNRRESSHEGRTCFPPPSGDAVGDSHTIQDIVSSLGFDWPDVLGVIDKVEEELAEVREALSDGDSHDARRELGDVFFALVNLARFLDVNASCSLRGANERFVDRFARMEGLLADEGLTIRECSFERLNGAWEKVKCEGEH